ncbi:PAS domain-containing protein [Sinorhizobium garamanticum]|uniref:PAS domain-containing protein n=1 Tax=Sinorhizobium garamanticum TaxID=680247 RepID=A0ABY8D8V6_9HYPH|nr:PAS domain-containing protein [Sinorhizobium garamanticum]WEX87321.1 PAS domain-containing protein [Sinorhizobium garamanticum]
MRSKTTTELFQYWNALRGERDLPRRDEIEPQEICALLPSLFILEQQPSGDIRFRLAGTHVCALFGRELRGQPFGALWSAGEAGEAIRIADQVMTQRSLAALSACGLTAGGDRLETELLLTPLGSPQGDSDRILGSLAPLSRPSWLHMTPVECLVAQGLQILGSGRGGRSDMAEASHAVDAKTHREEIGRKIQHLRIFEGGRER